MYRIATTLLLMLMALPAFAADAFPFALQSYRQLSKDRSDYGLARYNTEVKPCLEHVHTDWKQAKPRAQVTPLCVFRVGDARLSITDDEVQAVDYWDFTWEGEVASFVIEYDRQSLRYYQCRLPITSAKLEIVCTERDTAAWQKTTHVPL